MIYRIRPPGIAQPVAVKFASFSHPGRSVPISLFLPLCGHKRPLRLSPSDPNPAIYKLPFCRKDNFPLGCGIAGPEDLGLTPILSPVIVTTWVFATLRLHVVRAVARRAGLVGELI